MWFGGAAEWKGVYDVIVVVVNVVLVVVIVVTCCCCDVVDHGELLVDLVKVGRLPLCCCCLGCG